MMGGPTSRHPTKCENEVDDLIYYKIAQKHTKSHSTCWAAIPKLSLSNWGRDHGSADNKTYRHTQNTGNP